MALGIYLWPSVWKPEDRDKQCSGRYLPGVILNAGNIQCFVRVQFQHVKAVQQFFELHSVLLSRMRLWKRILL